MVVPEPVVEPGVDVEDPGTELEVAEVVWIVFDVLGDVDDGVAVVAEVAVDETGVVVLPKHCDDRG